VQGEEEKVSLSHLVGLPDTATTPSSHPFSVIIGRAGGASLSDWKVQDIHGYSCGQNNSFYYKFLQNANI